MTTSAENTRTTDCTRSWRSLRGAAIAVYALLGANIVMAVAGFVASLDQHALIDRVEAKPFTVTFAEFERADARVDTINGFSIAVIVVTAIAFAVWLRLAYQQIAELGFEHRYSVGWAAGGWFVPFLNFVRPKQIVDDIVDAQTFYDRESADAISLRRWTTAWWATWVVVVLLGAIINGTSNDPTTLNEVRNTASAYLVRDVLFAGAAVLAIVAVRRLTRRQHDFVLFR